MIMRTPEIEPTRKTIAETLTNLQDHLRSFPGTDYPWTEEPGDLDDQDPDVLYAWLLEAERASAAARALRDRVEALLLEDIRRHGPIKLGEMLYRPKKDTTVAWAHEDAPRRLLDYLSGTPEATRHPAIILDFMGEILNHIRIDAGNVRRTTLAATAAGRADAKSKEEIEAAGWAIFDTFFERRQDTDGDPRYVLGKVPMKRAPLWAQGLRHGERKP